METTPGHAAAKPGSEPQAHRMETILIVDDEEIIVKALTRLLKYEYNVLGALNGAEALELLRKNRVDLILSDNRMPQMGGVEFLSIAARLSPDTIRFLLTGYTDLSVMNAISEGVILKYITKPWDNMKLKEAIRSAIEQRELVKEGRARSTEARAQMEKVLAAVKGMR